MTSTILCNTLVTKSMSLNHSSKYNRIAVYGTVNTGKTTIINLLQNKDLLSGFTIINNISDVYLYPKIILETNTELSVVEKSMFDVVLIFEGQYDGNLGDYVLQ